VSAQDEVAEIARHTATTLDAHLIRTGVLYLTRLPKAVPDGRVLVHNHVRPTRHLGSRGFRAWLTDEGAERLEPCDCDWAPELGRHYRVRRAAS
jgi:hypothetical protein